MRRSRTSSWRSRTGTRSSSSPGVVDDREMRISHVIRAEEHLPTTPKAVLLWEALGTGELPLPAYAHLPVLVNEKRQKISKRRDRVAIEDYRAQGFLPEAMDNYLALLGWSPGDGRELFSLEELVSEFDLAHVNHSPAFFDQQKLLHFNGVYLRALPRRGFRRPLPPVGGRGRRHSGRGGPLLAGVRRSSLRSSKSGRPRCPRRPSLVEFLFAPDFVVEDSSFEKAILQGPRSGVDPGRGPRAARELRLRGRVAQDRDHRARREARTQARQGTGADPGRRPRSQRRAAPLRIPRGARPRPDPRAHRRRHRPARSEPLLARAPRQGQGCSAGVRGSAPPARTPCLRDPRVAPVTHDHAHSGVV